MPEPFVFVTTHRIHPGQEEAVDRLAAEFAADVESADTGLLHFAFHLDEAGTRVANVQVHQDAASMEAYLPAVRDRIHQALAITTTETIEVFGEPGPALREALRHNWDAGARVRVMPRRAAGFTRTALAA